eukprot:scaffold5048_cov83-Skeletonema_marinoi.AAC.2
MPTPTITSQEATTTTTTDAVQQAPRTPQEFQFAHRLLRKLVQDSTFFPVESAQRDYVWFPPRGSGLHHDDDSNKTAADVNDSNNTSDVPSTSTTISNNESSCPENSEESSDSSHHHDDENNHHQQIQPPQQPHQPQQQRRRTVSTPLFIDYCLRSYTAEINHHQRRRSSLNNNMTRSNERILSTASTMSTSSRRASSPLSFCSSTSSVIVHNNNKVIIGSNSNNNNNNGSCNSTVITTAGDDSYEEENGGTSPISVCSVATPMSSGGDNAIHPVVTAELPFARSKKLGGDRLGHHQGQCNNDEGGGRQQNQQEVYSRTLSRKPLTDPCEELIRAANRSAAAQSKLTTATTTTTTAIPTNTSATTTTQTHTVHCIHEKELEFGKILGSGGFGQVRLARIKSSPLSSLSDATIDTTDAATNAVKAADNATAIDTTKEATNNSNNNKYFAMKYLSPNKTSPPPPTEEEEETINYVSKFERGIADLAMEARYLSVLSHENIVTLWFVSEGSLEEVFNCGDEGGGGGNGSGRRRRKSIVKHHGNNDSSSSSNAEGGRHHQQHGYFLLLDALHETLHQRISHSYIPQVVDTPLRIYQTNKKAYSNNTHIAKVQLAKRLSSLKSIALALQYLHVDCNLIYRDIKPSNIGFHRRYDGGDGLSCTCGHVESSGDDQQQSSKCTCNYTDIPKLFDFGLAKELKSKFRKAHPAHSHDDPPTFKLTSATGSRRYMSPEVALREPYNHKADVYSFGMVVYQISALVVPFHGLAMKNHEQVVAREGLRPDVTIPSKESSVRRTRDFRRHYSKEKDRGKKILMLSKRARCVWPEGLNALITECWDDDMRKRPEMREVVERLDACIEELNQRSTSS